MTAGATAIRPDPAHRPANDNWLNGDFSGFLARSTSGTSTRIVNGVTVRDRFPGNIIPANLISPTMQKLLRAYMVRPNLTGDAVVNNYNFVDFRKQTNDSNSFQVRLDHHFSTNDSVFFRWTERRIKGLLPVGDVGFKTPRRSTATGAAVGSTRSRPA